LAEAVERMHDNLFLVEHEAAHGALRSLPGDIGAAAGNCGGVAGRPRPMTGMERVTISATAASPTVACGPTTDAA